MKYYLIVPLFFFYLIGNSQHLDKSLSNPPIDSAILFTVANINTVINDESIVYISENREFIIFDRLKNDFKDWENYPFYTTAYINGKWSKPELTKYPGRPWFHNLPNPNQNEDIIFADWFSSTKKNQPTEINISRSIYSNGDWSASIELPEAINSCSLDSWPSKALNGNLYFFSTRNEGSGEADIYVAEIENNYDKVRNLGTKINSKYWEHDPCISQDESFIIYCSNKAGGYGRDDIYIAFQNEKGNWDLPINLGSKINSKYSDNRPYLTPDEKFLFFSSDRNGSLDVFWIHTDFIKYRNKKYIDFEIPDSIPKIFLQGYINNDTNGAFCSVFSPQMEKFYFTRLNTDGSTPGVLANLSKTENGWSNVDTLPFTSGKYHDNDMCISQDGNKMIFRSFRPLPDGKLPIGHAYLWFAEKENEKWGNAQPLYCGNKLVSTGYPSITQSNTIYFSYSNRTNTGIFKSVFENNKYRTPVHEYSVLDSITTEGDLFVSPDESYMIISCYNHPENLYSLKGDLYVAFKDERGNWTKAYNLGNLINTECTENCPAVTPDGEFLFFNRYCDETNTGNIYWVSIDIIKTLRKKYN